MTEETLDKALELRGNMLACQRVTDVLLSYVKSDAHEQVVEACMNQSGRRFAAKVREYIRTLSSEWHEECKTELEKL